MSTFNLDDARALRAAQSEAADEPHTVILGGRKFQIPAQVPARFLLHLGKLERGDLGALEDALRDLLGDQFDDFIALTETQNDLMAFLEGVSTELYGLSEGEAPASPPSSKATSGRSRPTGKRTTAAAAS